MDYDENAVFPQPVAAVPHARARPLGVALYLLCLMLSSCSMSEHKTEFPDRTPKQTEKMHKRKRFGGKQQGGRGEGRPSWVKDGTEERHVGSYPLDEIKSSPEYEKRITQPEHSVKRKYALCVSYLGTNYQGLQINPGAKTIEQELERALFLSGGIIEQNYGYMHKVQWSRAARTDRGVHALTQCCAMKLLLPEKERSQFMEHVNAFLPSDIKLQTMTKVSKSFNAKNLCTKRRYHYLLPTFTLQKVQEINQVLTEAYKAQGPVKGAGYESGYVDPNTSRTLTKDTLQSMRQSFVDYRVTSDIIESFRTALHAYEGTKNYHNFTSGKDSSEANSKRYILSFTCSEPFICQTTNVEYVLLSVLGQSFLLNQIRKMVHFAIEICRGGATLDDLTIAFTDDKVEIPMAPALGLYLDELYFEGYNIKQRYETENDKRVIQKHKDEAAEAANVVAPEGEDENAGEEEGANPTTKKQKVEEDDANNAATNADNGGDGEDEGGIREEIEWYALPDVKEKIDAFRSDILHPHIMKEVKSNYYTIIFGIHINLYLIL